MIGTARRVEATERTRPPTADALPREAVLHDLRATMNDLALELQRARRADGADRVRALDAVGRGLQHLAVLTNALLLPHRPW